MKLLSFRCLFRAQRFLSLNKLFLYQIEFLSSSHVDRLFKNVEIAQILLASSADFLKQERRICSFNNNKS